MISDRRKSEKRENEEEYDFNFGSICCFYVYNNITFCSGTMALWSDFTLCCSSKPLLENKSKEVNHRSA